MAGWGVRGRAAARVFARACCGDASRAGCSLAAVCGAAGLAFGAWMDVYQWTLAARQDLDSYLAIAATSLPYNLAHAIGNVGFSLLIGPAFVRALRRYRRRFEVRWPAPAGAAAAALLLAVVAALAMPPRPRRRRPPRKAERYLRRRAEPRRRLRQRARLRARAPSSAAGRRSAWRPPVDNPRDVRRGTGARCPPTSAKSGRSERDIGEVERTVMVLRAAGLSPPRFGGRDLVAEIRARRRGDGSIARLRELHRVRDPRAARGAGRAPAARPSRWLGGSQNADGGFGVARSAQSDADMTGAALQALAVTGRARGRVGAPRGGATCARSRTATAASARWPGAARTRSPPPTRCRASWPWAPAAADRPRALGYLRRRQRARRERRLLAPTASRPRCGSPRRRCMALRRRRCRSPRGRGAPKPAAGRELGRRRRARTRPTAAETQRPRQRAEKDKPAQDGAADGRRRGRRGARRARRARQARARRRTPHRHRARPARPRRTRQRRVALARRSAGAVPVMAALVPVQAPAASPAASRG